MMPRSTNDWNTRSTCCRRAGENPTASGDATRSAIMSGTSHRVTLPRALRLNAAQIREQGRDWLAFGEARRAELVEARLGTRALEQSGSDGFANGRRDLEAVAEAA